MTDAATGWVVVADSPFVPAMVGGHREHAGFVDTAVAAGLVAAVVVPYQPGDEPAPTHRAGDHEVPVVAVPRDMRRRHLIAPRAPFVVSSRPAPPWLVPTVAGLAPHAGAVIVFSYKSHALGRALAEGLGVPAVLRQHNLEGHYHRELGRGTPGPRGWLLRFEGHRVDRDERRLEHARWLRAIADISATDAEHRRARASVPVHHVPPFAVTEHQVVARDPGPDEVLFLGSLDLATNHDGLRWFVERVWPVVRGRVPGSRLTVVGSRPPGSLVRLLAAVPGVELHADVPDVRPYLARATVAVNPTVSGSGVNIKLVEYLVSGIPTVTTSRAAAGLGLEAGRDVAVADDPEGFATAVADALADPARAQRTADERVDELRERYVAEHSLERMATLLGATAGPCGALGGPG